MSVSSAVLGTFAPDALAGNVYIVTGAASGQGRACAVGLAAAGAKVVAVDVQAAALGRAVREVDDHGGRAVAVEVDLSIETCGEVVAATALEAYGRIDGLLNCAAIAGVRSGLMGTIETTPLAAWERAFATNVRSIYLLSQAVVPHLRAAGGGSIVNWSSAAAFQGQNPGSAAYAASKGAVVAMTNTMAATLGADGIRVNTIVPGLVTSPMTEEFLSPVRDAIDAGRIVPVGRVGTPDDIAGIALFLVSTASSFLSGATIFVDGGAHVEQRWDNAVAAANLELRHPVNDMES